MDDRHLKTLLCDRSEEALAAMDARFGPRLLQTARNILADAQDAEECVNDTFLAVWNAIPPEDPDPLAGYIFRIGRNLALKRLRHNTAAKRNARHDLSLDELSGCISAGTLEQSLSARELGQAIDRFLSGLPKNNRIIFLRRYWFGDSTADIARALGYTQGAVSTRLSRTREKLRTYLIQEGYFYE